jgi:hypothetical protein
MMKKIDLKKDLKDLYNPFAKEVGEIDVPKMNFLMIDGAGDPNNSQEFSNAVEALFSVSYSVWSYEAQRKHFSPTFV